MSYIGRDLRTGAFRQLDDISSGFDGSDTTHTMQVNSTNVSVGDVNQILLSLGGVIQKPGTDFTISGSTLTFTTAPAANTSFFAILLGSDNGGTVTPTDASVTTAKIVDDAVSAAKIDINGAELFLDADDDTSITADTDDQIDFKVGGNDTHVFDANGHVTLKQYLDATTAGGRVTGASNRGSTARVNLYQTAGSSDGGEIRLETANTSNSMTEAVRIHNNQVMSASAGVALGVGTANTSSNVLDDYEIGTYDVTVTGSSSGSMTIGAANTTQAYVKIGKLVHVQGYIGCTADNSISGNIRFSLPFTNASGLADDADYAYGTVMLQNNGSDYGGVTRGFTYDGAGAFCYIVSTTTAGVTDYIQHGDTDDVFQIGYGFTYRTTA